MTTTRTGRVVQIGLVCLAMVGFSAWAQEGRDPTAAPLEAGTAAVAATASPIGVEGMSVVMRDGKPLLIVGTRLYSVGQSVGAFKIERISETEVWLRNGKELTKIPRFAGVQRTVVQAVDCKPTKPVAKRAAKPAAQGKPTQKPMATPSVAGGGAAAPLPASPNDVPCKGAPL